MKDFPVSRRRLEGDSHLRMLTGLLGKTLESFGVTVIVSGEVLSGLAISRDEWVEQWLEGVRSSGPGGDMFATVVEMSVEQSGVYILEDNLPGLDSPLYLHLKDVQMGPAGDATFSLFRVRLSEISAWSPNVIRSS
ncbi:hypothetical protein [Lentzea sp. NPDC060358]|uniref:hypothetical protein n=1 Tax=Lentzea sp. NPDC060358 TaxID=3347103 RepID=UPI0036673B19